ncbi:uncharacterized protein LOC125236476 [Leguminivora glycinivorella]|uniref:uncharacterized protein LOC125236476 n=1 Tax=Leguminivora glycinivorella TaxID=1035111 RepID=UPI00200F216E|nr:uncharacterized protein LOC125236476 [Leguminivora glycinivorella]
MTLKLKILLIIITYWSIMIIQAVAAFFKYKIVSSIIILACGNEFEQMRLVRQLSLQGMRATVSCDPSILNVNHKSLQGVLYISRPNDTLLDKTSRNHFSMRFKWLLIGDEVPPRFNYSIRYDADITFFDSQQGVTQTIDATNDTSVAYHESVFFEDLYIHCRDGVSRHPWAVWSTAGFRPMFELERIRRRHNLKQYPMRIATPVGHYDDSYAGTFADYLVDNASPGQDSAIRCSYGTASLILEWLQAKEVIEEMEQWGHDAGNKSMFTRVAQGTSEIGGAILRIQNQRLTKLDYVIPLWPFKVGFTYVGERESSSNMFVIPFTGATWAACAVVTIILALAQRATAKEHAEKEGALVAVIATLLQQDASAVPEGASGRITFLVLSVCSMLMYAYYSSAIVSALMSAGSSGPTTLRALGDSRYRIASEDYEWQRHQMFDKFIPDWPELEYLKRKKLQSMTNFYMDWQAGMQLVKSGTTAYHAEYNHMYPLMSVLSDDQLCKLQYVHTVPPVMSWVVTTKRGQWTNVLRIGGDWLHETGLATRMLSRWQVKPPPCRAALLAERVSYGDVASLIVLTVVGFVASFAVLFVERAVAKSQSKKKNKGDDKSQEETVDGII